MMEHQLKVTRGPCLMSYQQNKEGIIITEILHAQTIVFCIHSPSLDNKIWQLLQRQAMKDNSTQWSDGLWKVSICIFSFEHTLCLFLAFTNRVFLLLKNSRKLKGHQQTKNLLIFRFSEALASKWRASKYFCLQQIGWVTQWPNSN